MLTAILLLIGFYVLALAVGLGSLALAVLQWTTDLPQNIWLTLACAVLGLTILSSIFPRRLPFHPPGPELQRENEPDLLALVDEVAGAVGQETPERVYLAPDVNASVTHHGGLLGLGGRRVMVVGLPLLDALTVSQLRAVLAHEFGHFHSGDTRLLPWFTRTYDALERTVISLHELESVWRKPFTWYFDFFLRRSSSVRRRQEFVADALAARVAGKETAIETLSVVARAAPAYDGFWSGEASPVLESGHRAGLLEGFRRFQRARPVDEAVDELFAEELARETDPYDVHPSHAERVDALRSLDPGEPRFPEDDRPAIELLRDVDEAEYALLCSIGGEELVRSMERVSWDDVPERVMVPGWRATAAGSGDALRGITADGIPDVLSDLEPIVQRAVPSEQLPPRGEPRRAMGLGLLSTGFALGLYDAGWSLSAPPGEPVGFESNGNRVEPFTVVWELGDGKLPADDWRRRCEELGIVGLPLEPSPELQAAG